VTKLIESEIKMSKLLDKFNAEARFNHVSFTKFYRETRFATRTMYHLFFVTNKDRHKLDESFAVVSRVLVQHEHDEDSYIEVDAASRVGIENESFEICEECLRYRDFHFAREQFEHLSSEREILSALRVLADARSARNLQLYREFLIEHEEYKILMKRIAMIRLRMMQMRQEQE